MLPFIQPPAPAVKRRIGNPQTGVLELDVRGGLTVAEGAMIERLMADHPSSYTKGAQIADAIAKAEGISIVEAFKIVQDAVVGNELEPAAEAIRLRHSAAVEEVVKVYAATGEMSMLATVTAMVSCRLSQPGWTMEQTKAMPRALFMGLWELAQEEIAAENTVSTPPTEEALKKLPAGTGKRQRTGKQSSGTSAASSQGNGIAAASALN